MTPAPKRIMSLLQGIGPALDREIQTAGDVRDLVEVLEELAALLAHVVPRLADPADGTDLEGAGLSAERLESLSTAVAAVQAGISLTYSLRMKGTNATTLAAAAWIRRDHQTAQRLRAGAKLAERLDREAPVTALNPSPPSDPKAPNPRPPRRRKGRGAR